MIAAAILREQVASTAPFLLAPLRVPQGDEAGPADIRDPLASGGQPRGWLSILQRPPAELESGDGYFALCCACHHASVATYVPTDVDRQIRSGLWREGVDAGARARRAAFALAARRWDLTGISARVVGTGSERLSGHDGEWLAVLIGALLATQPGEEELGQRLEAGIEEELQRQARSFQSLQARPGSELDVLRAAAILSHNAGDVDQGLSLAGEASPWHARWALLSHQGRTRYSGALLTAGRIYKATLASEGHRNYPLRQARCLRRHAELLLPISPFLDRWGGVVASHGALSTDDRVAVAGQLLEGCRTIPGQLGYQRALSGLIEAWPGGAAGLARQLPAAGRRQLERPELRKSLAVSQGSFESMMRKRLQAAQAG